jgi:co-chaperonin GroES (HSP10)
MSVVPGLKDFPMLLLGDLVAVLPESTVLASGITLPDWSRSLWGSVLARGPDCTEVKVGDVVNFGAASGIESVFDGAAIRIMREERDILAVRE